MAKLWNLFKTSNHGNRSGHFTVMGGSEAGDDLVLIQTFLPYYVNFRNGKRAACNHGVMDARGRLLCTKEA